MGAEATCALRENDGSARHTGRALLETDALIFRGADGYGVKLPLASLRNVRAVRGDLMIDAPSGSFALELGGEKAERWADGAIWVIHPKGAESKVKDTDIFAAAKKIGLTATKVVRFSDTHTAEKLVIPVANR